MEPSKADGSDRLEGSSERDSSSRRGGHFLEPPYTGLLRAAVLPVTETVKLISVGLLPPEIRRLFGFGWDPGREALLRSTLLQLRVGSRFWLDAVRIHPAARAAVGERYGTLAD